MLSGLSAHSQVAGVSEGGFGPPRAIRPLGPQPVRVHGASRPQGSSSVLTCTDTGDLVAAVAPSSPGLAVARGNGGETY